MTAKGKITSTAIDVVDTISMRKMLIAGMQDVLTGQITPGQAAGACGFARQIYYMSALELRVMLTKAKLNGKQPENVSFVGNAAKTHVRRAA